MAIECLCWTDGARIRLCTTHAAAPALLAALRELLDATDRIMPDPTNFHDMMLARSAAHLAIAQAEPPPTRTPGGDVCSICRSPIIDGKWHEHACE